MDSDDTWQQHAADTLTESYLLADPETVRVVTEGAADSIGDLERWGMAFAHEQDGRISQRFFGAHTFRRTAFAGDYTGLELQRTVIKRTAQLTIPTLDSTYITKLLVRDNVVFGAYSFDLQNGTRYTIHADAVILATGGHPNIRTSKLRKPGHRPRTFKGARDRIDARFSSSAIWTRISSRNYQSRHVRVANPLNAADERNPSCASESTLRQAVHTE